MKKRLIFKEEIYDHVPYSKQYFYDAKLDEVDDIKRAIDRNRALIKTGIRAKWYNSDNPTVQIALYKLVSSEEERKLLATNYQQHSLLVEQPLFPEDIKTDDDVQADDSGK